MPPPLRRPVNFRYDSSCDDRRLPELIDVMISIYFNEFYPRDPTAEDLGMAVFDAFPQEDPRDLEQLMEDAFRTSMNGKRRAAFTGKSTCGPTPAVLDAMNFELRCEAIKYLRTKRGSAPVEHVISKIGKVCKLPTRFVEDFLSSATHSRSSLYCMTVKGDVIHLASDFVETEGGDDLLGPNKKTKQELQTIDDDENRDGVVPEGGERDVQHFVIRMFRDAEKRERVFEGIERKVVFRRVYDAFLWCDKRCARTFIDELTYASKSSDQIMFLRADAAERVEKHRTKSGDAATAAKPSSVPVAVVSPLPVIAADANLTTLLRPHEILMRLVKCFTEAATPPLRGALKKSVLIQWMMKAYRLELLGENPSEEAVAARQRLKEGILAAVVEKDKPPLPVTVVLSDQSLQSARNTNMSAYGNTMKHFLIKPPPGKQIINGGVNKGYLWARLSAAHPAVTREEFDELVESKTKPIIHEVPHVAQNHRLWKATAADSTTATTASPRSLDSTRVAAPLSEVQDYVNSLADDFFAARAIRLRKVSAAAHGSSGVDHHFVRRDRVRQHLLDTIEERMTSNPRDRIAEGLASLGGQTKVVVNTALSARSQGRGPYVVSRRAPAKVVGLSMEAWQPDVDLEEEEERNNRKDEVDDSDEPHHTPAPPEAKKAPLTNEEICKMVHMLLAAEVENYFFLTAPGKSQFPDGVTSRQDLHNHLWAAFTNPSCRVSFAVDHSDLRRSDKRTCVDTVLAAESCSATPASSSVLVWRRCSKTIKHLYGSLTRFLQQLVEVHNKSSGTNGATPKADGNATKQDACLSFKEGGLSYEMLFDHLCLSCEGVEDVLITRDIVNQVIRSVTLVGDNCVIPIDLCGETSPETVLKEAEAKLEQRQKEAAEAALAAQREEWVKERDAVREQQQKEVAAKAAESTKANSSIADLMVGLEPRAVCFAQLASNYLQRCEGHTAKLEDLRNYLFDLDEVPAVVTTFINSKELRKTINIGIQAVSANHNSIVVWRRVPNCGRIAVQLGDLDTLQREVMQYLKNSHENYCATAKAIAHLKKKFPNFSEEVIAEKLQAETIGDGSWSVSKTLLKNPEEVLEWLQGKARKKPAIRQVPNPPKSAKKDKEKFGRTVLAVEKAAAEASTTIIRNKPIPHANNEKKNRSVTQTVEAIVSGSLSEESQLHGSSSATDAVNNSNSSERFYEQVVAAVGDLGEMIASGTKPVKTAPAPKTPPTVDEVSEEVPLEAVVISAVYRLLSVGDTLTHLGKKTTTSHRHHPTLLSLASTSSVDITQRYLAATLDTFEPSNPQSMAILLRNFRDTIFSSSAPSSSSSEFPELLRPNELDGNSSGSTPPRSPSLPPSLAPGDEVIATSESKEDVGPTSAATNSVNLRELMLELATLPMLRTIPIAVIWLMLCVVDEHAVFMKHVVGERHADYLSNEMRETRKKLRDLKNKLRYSKLSNGDKRRVSNLCSANNELLRQALNQKEERNYGLSPDVMGQVFLELAEASSISVIAAAQAAHTEVLAEKQVDKGCSTIEDGTTHDADVEEANSTLKRKRSESPTTNIAQHPPKEQEDFSTGEKSSTTVGDDLDKHDEKEKPGTEEDMLLQKRKKVEGEEESSANTALEGTQPENNVAGVGEPVQVSNSVVDSSSLPPNDKKTEASTRVASKLPMEMRVDSNTTTTAFDLASYLVFSEFFNDDDDQKKKKRRSDECTAKTLCAKITQVSSELGGCGLWSHKKMESTLAVSRTWSPHSSRSSSNPEVAVFRRSTGDHDVLRLINDSKDVLDAMLRLKGKAERRGEFKERLRDNEDVVVDAMLRTHTLREMPSVILKYEVHRIMKLPEWRKCDGEEAEESTTAEEKQDENAQDVSQSQHEDGSGKEAPLEENPASPSRANSAAGSRGTNESCLPTGGRQMQQEEEPSSQQGGAFTPRCIEGYCAVSVDDIMPDVTNEETSSSMFDPPSLAAKPAPIFVYPPAAASAEDHNVRVRGHSDLSPMVFANLSAVSRDCVSESEGCEYRHHQGMVGALPKHSSEKHLTQLIPSFTNLFLNDAELTVDGDTKSNLAHVVNTSPPPATAVSSSAPSSLLSVFPFLHSLSALMASSFFSAGCSDGTVDELPTHPLPLSREKESLLDSIFGPTEAAVDNSTPNEDDCDAVKEEEQQQDSDGPLVKVKVEEEDDEAAGSHPDGMLLHQENPTSPPLTTTTSSTAATSSSSFLRDVASMFLDDQDAAIGLVDGIQSTFLAGHDGALSSGTAASCSEECATSPAAVGVNNTHDALRQLCYEELARHDVVPAVWSRRKQAPKVTPFQANAADHHQLPLPMLVDLGTCDDASPSDNVTVKVEEEGPTSSSAPPQNPLQHQEDQQPLQKGTAQQDPVDGGVWFTIVDEESLGLV